MTNQSRKSGNTSKGKGAASGDVAPFLRKSSEWKGYVNVEFTESDKQNFRVFNVDDSLVSETMAEALSRGYKVSVVQSSEDGTYKGTIHSAYAGQPDSGYAASAWQGTPSDAIAAVVFIVSMIAQYDLSRFVTSEGLSRKFTF